MVGDASVLEEYLQGLGTGVTRFLPLSREEISVPSLSAGERQKITDAIRETAAAPNSNSTDSKLMELRNRLKRQFDECNNHCMSFSRQRLFDPEPEASTEAFEYGMCSRADSKWLFETFIKYLYQVFCERLPEGFRRSAKGPNLMPPLADVAAILNGPEFGQLATLRHKLSHNASPDDVYRLSQVTERLIGIRSLTRDNAEGWFRMQVATMEMLSGILTQVQQIFEKAQTPAVSDRDPEAPVIRW